MNHMCVCGPLPRQAIIHVAGSKDKRTEKLFAGPLSLTAAPTSEAALILRKPDLPIASDWEVEILPA